LASPLFRESQIVNGKSSRDSPVTVPHSPLHIISEGSPFWASVPFTLSHISPLPGWPAIATVFIAVHGAELPNALPISQGLPIFLASPYLRERQHRAVGSNGVRGLHEEKGRLAVRVVPHLARVLRVVAAHAINAADEELPGPR